MENSCQEAEDRRQTKEGQDVIWELIPVPEWLNKLIRLLAHSWAKMNGWCSQHVPSNECRRNYIRWFPLKLTVKSQLDLMIIRILWWLALRSILRLVLQLYPVVEENKLTCDHDDWSYQDDIGKVLAIPPEKSEQIRDDQDEGNERRKSIVLVCLNHCIGLHHIPDARTNHHP